MRFLFLILALSVLAGPAGAQPDTTITYQGQLQEGGAPFDGQVEMTFELFDDETGGSPVASPIAKDVDVTGGMFQVELDFDAVHGQQGWLEITVDGGDPLDRQPVTAAPVATHALNVADGVSGVWNKSGDTISYVANNQSIVFDPDGDAGEGPRIGMGHADNEANGQGATVSGGGQSGEANLASASYSVIAGGFNNTAGGTNSVISGGADNDAAGAAATVGGGRFNLAESTSTTIAGGLSNEATGSSSVISGGWRNKAGDSLSVVPGGQENEARARYSFAGGYNAIVEAEHRGAFVWADDVNELDEIASDRGEPFQSQVANEFAVRATGGFRFVSDIDDVGEAVQLMHFNPDGRLGINTGSPLAALHVESASDEDPLRVRVDGSTGLRVADDQGVSVGTNLSAPAYGLRVLGEFELNSLGDGGSTDLCRTADDIVSDCSSARRFKQDIQPLETAGALIDRLRAVRFNWRKTGKADIGLIAEEVAEVEPDLVNYGDDGEIRGVKYRHLTAVLTRALQEQKIEFESWQQDARDRLAALESENARLQLAVEKNAELAERNRELEQRLTALEAVLLEDERVTRHAD